MFRRRLLLEELLELELLEKPFELLLEVLLDLLPAPPFELLDAPELLELLI